MGRKNGNTQPKRNVWRRKGPIQLTQDEIRENIVKKLEQDIKGGKH